MRLIHVHPSNNHSKVEKDRCTSLQTRARPRPICLLPSFRNWNPNDTLSRDNDNRQSHVVSTKAGSAQFCNLSLIEEKECILLRFSLYCAALPKNSELSCHGQNRPLLFFTNKGVFCSQTFENSKNFIC